MAVIHRPDFSLGDSTIAGAAMGGDNSYERPPDAQDANYPETTYTEAIDIGAVGPAGEPGFDVYPNAAEYGVMAFVQALVGPEAGYVIPHAQYNYLKARFKFTATGHADTGFATLLTIGTRDLNANVADNVITVYINDTTLTVEGFSEDGGVHSGTAAITIDEGWHLVELRFHPGTVVDTPSPFFDVLSDGWITVYVDGVAVIDLQDIDLYTDATFTNSDNRFSSYAVGFFGLYGAVYDVELGYPDDGPPRNDSTPCCADHPDPGGPGGNPGPTLGPDPFTPIPEWARQCAGGGVVPQAADQTDSESWAV